MNLQITSPYKTCPFSCPCCIANRGDEFYPFENLYEKDKELYFQELGNFLNNNDINDIVITGDTEPTLFMDWLKEVVDFIPNSYKLEIQTKNYSVINALLETNIDKICISALSCDDIYKIIKQFEKSNGSCLNHIERLRLVLLETKDIVSNFNSVCYGFTLTHFSEITVKRLQYGKVDFINDWINQNQKVLNFNRYYMAMRGRDDDKNGFSNTGVKYDSNCNDSEGRYCIFRIDGKVYKDWETLKSI